MWEKKSSTRWKHFNFTWLQPTLTRNRYLSHVNPIFCLDGAKYFLRWQEMEIIFKCIFLNLMFLVADKNNERERNFSALFQVKITIWRLNCKFPRMLKGISRRAGWRFLLEILVSDKRMAWKLIFWRRGEFEYWKNSVKYNWVRVWWWSRFL